MSPTLSLPRPRRVWGKGGEKSHGVVGQVRGGGGGALTQIGQQIRKSHTHTCTHICTCSCTHIHTYICIHAHTYFIEMVCYLRYYVNSLIFNFGVDWDKRHCVAEINVTPSLKGSARTLFWLGLKKEIQQKIAT